MRNRSRRHTVHINLVCEEKETPRHAKQCEDVPVKYLLYILNIYAKYMLNTYAKAKKERDWYI